MTTPEPSAGIRGEGAGGGASAPPPYNALLGRSLANVSDAMRAAYCQQLAASNAMLLRMRGFQDARALRQYGRRIEPRDPGRGIGPPCAHCRNRGLVRLWSSVTPVVPIYACTSCGGFSYFIVAKGGAVPCNPTPRELERLRLWYLEVERQGGDTSGLAKPWVSE